MLKHLPFFLFSFIFCLFSFFHQTAFTQTPVISVTPSSFTENLFTGGSTSQTMTISNSGDGDLNYLISTNYLENLENANWALQFDGVDDMVRFPSLGLPVGNSNRTIELWFRRESQPWGEGTLVGYGNWGQFNQVYEIFTYTIPTDYLAFSQWGEGFVGNNIIYSGQWYHAAVVNIYYNDVILYLNGQLDNTGYLNISTVLSDSSLVMGKAPTGFDQERRFNGDIDEVRIWNVARTQAEIQFNMYRELSGSEPGLVGYWKFNEGSGTIAHDQTINQNHGQLNGGVTWMPSSAPVSPVWLTIHPDSGVVLPASSTDITLNLNAQNMQGGSYQANLSISSNDLVSPLVTVPVNLNVANAPCLSVSQDTLDFGQTFVGTKDTLEIVVYNTGTQDLLIFNATVQPSEYEVFPPFASIDPRESDVFMVAFSPQAVGNYSGTLTFFSNDPAKSTYWVTLLGHGIEPPILSISPNSFTQTLAPGQTAVQTLTIGNTGGCDLKFEFSPGDITENYALKFDGIDDFVLMGNPQIYNLKYFTLESWVNVDSYVWAAGIMTLGEINSERFSIHLGDNNAFCYMQDWPNVWELDGQLLDMNTWYHFAVTHNGSTVKLYLNGELNTSGEISSPTNYSSSYSLCFGNQIGGSPEYLNGKLEEIRIWNVEKSAAEIQSLMNIELLGSEPGLVGYWNFNEASGTTTHDLTINHNHGQLEGGVTRVLSTAPLSPPWLTVNPSSGVCCVNSTVDITVQFNAADLDTGVYNGNIFLECNDPFLSDCTIPVTLTVSNTIGITTQSFIPKQFCLYQNYPNPFNPVTEISFDLPKTSEVTLKIYNILGEEVVTLVSEQLPAGTHSYEWNASHNASGVYLFKIETEEYIETKKMILTVI